MDMGLENILWRCATIKNIGGQITISTYTYKRDTHQVVGQVGIFVIHLVSQDTLKGKCTKEFS